MDRTFTFIALCGFASIVVPASVMQASAQSALDEAYEKERATLQMAIEDAAGSTRAAIVLPISALEIPAVAQSFTPVVKDPESNLAIEGYDPVGYFTAGTAMLGNPEFNAEYEGAVFYFATADHREMFLKTPERFVPAYGGYCTETVASGSLTPASPTHWTLHGDRLYLTRSAGANQSFREHRARSIEAADQYWDQASAFRMNNNFKATNRDG